MLTRFTRSWPVAAGAFMLAASAPALVSCSAGIGSPDARSGTTQPTTITATDAVNPGSPAMSMSDSVPPSEMSLGTFSVSLAVKDLGASRAFYEAFGFTQIGGNPDQNWLILQNGDATIGLFQGMFEQNILTFNPGWARSGDHPADGAFSDIRQLQAALKERGLEFVTEADPDTTGPASFTLLDPDGNPVLVDQHR